VIEASAEAFLQVINRLAARREGEKRIRPTENPG